MKKVAYWQIGFALLLVASACKKASTGNPEPPAVLAKDFNTGNWYVNGVSNSYYYTNTSLNPQIRIEFTNALNRTSTATGIVLGDAVGGAVAFSANYEKGDSIVVLQPSSPLSYLTKYTLTINNQLRSKDGGKYIGQDVINLLTRMDSSSKFPAISDTALLTLVQRQTFKYFWDYAHPVSGLARERTGLAEVVTTGGSGFGLMSLPVGINRGFITRAEGIQRAQKVLTFLNTKATKYHGAFAHWLNGTTGVTIPFSSKDDGADLVETSYLMMGLITLRQYFNSVAADETALRSSIDSIVDGVEWSWFRKNGENQLYWHWSPNGAWQMNMAIQGWNEGLITFIMAASAKNNPIPKIVYDNGWARNGAIRNGKSFYGYPLPLGQDYGGPLFFCHYTFMGIDPRGLSDAYANYQTQMVNHTKINWEYCKVNPMAWFGYSADCWGLTASDIPNGYAASSPTNDLGVIAPTAALSSMPYTPEASMHALKFFYYTLGDKLWKEYGFIDAFSVHKNWYANSFLAIDQGPIIVMIENYRTGLLWQLFTSAPEVKTGLRSLGFSAPYL